MYKMKTPLIFLLALLVMNLVLFANFIKTANPNGAEVPNWPAAEPNDTEPSIMIIDTKSGAEKASKDARYVLMDKVFNN